MKPKTLWLALALCITLTQVSAALADETVAIRAGKVYTGDGVIEGATVVIRDGKIAAVGPNVPIPDGATVIERPDGSITAGLIDAYSTAGVARSDSWSEHESEVIPHLRTLDAWDLLSRDFDRLAHDGVTTIFLAGDPASVIGSSGAVVKTDRKGTGRVLVEAAQPMITFSVETWSRGQGNRTPFGTAQTYLTRRPTTGMGNTWVVREAFHTAARNEWGREKDDVLAPSHGELVRIMEGESSLRALARRRHDIYTAIRLTREFGIERFTLIEATEAYRIADDLAEAGVAVVFGPMFESPRGQWRIRSGEANEPNLASAAILHEAGVTLALTASDLFRETSLAEQATFAVRFGLPVEAAVRAVTATPAALLGVSDRLGTIAAGKDGDLVVWSGEPFAATSGIEAVVLSGKVVHERNDG